MKIVLVNASNAHIIFTNLLGNDNNSYIYDISKAEESYTCNTNWILEKSYHKESNSKIIMEDITKYKQYSYVA